MVLAFSQPIKLRSLTMHNPVSLTTEQVDTIDASLKKALAIADLLVQCGPHEQYRGEVASPGSLTAVFQMIVDALGKAIAVMNAVRK